MPPRTFARIALPFLLLCTLAAHADDAADEARFLKESVDFFDQVTRANLPRQVDKVTTLNSVQLDPAKKMLYYRYAISTLRLDQMDLGARAKFESGLKSQLESSTCQQPDLLERFRQHHLSVTHEYTGSDGKPLASVTVDPQSLDCTRT
ncbi:hypothetical protein NK553_13300 [Pseudomonas sp. ZM23]|uniref:Uncharacterized protein n=1 Tax=Pseudomonas triclosanedens TaxID=2961893 RepID=A0ABY7A3B6_9PSED|nr:hypothetical protein [Pseudomonas triclosanedens]MCP8464924.1 hypothetical protein [Pseudomonas triclosanedens]MCP8470364.1 hypothetical protein [Pseudomonas triclosanedens]MCP8476169.1 hypothetical protein [Pseudomonas triclosanedens]WAI51598.1 hypothetical protein OU419_10225 [Pseudomonas triclosanedens]